MSTILPALTSHTLELTGDRMAVNDVTAGGQTGNYILSSFILFLFSSKRDGLK